MTSLASKKIPLYGELVLTLLELEEASGDFRAVSWCYVRMLTRSLMRKATDG